MKPTTDWRDQLGNAFGIDPDSVQQVEEAPAKEQPSALDRQGRKPLSILLDKKGRAGKQATLVVDWTIDDDALKDMARQLKQHCGVGGSARGGEILLQGDVRQAVLDYLTAAGFKARII